MVIVVINAKGMTNFLPEETVATCNTNDLFEIEENGRWFVMAYAVGIRDSCDEKELRGKIGCHCSLRDVRGRDYHVTGLKLANVEDMKNRKGWVQLKLQVTEETKRHDDYMELKDTVSTMKRYTDEINERVNEANDLNEKLEEQLGEANEVLKRLVSVISGLSQD